VKPPAAPPFLARDSYRLRRLMDAARFLPAFGFVLMLLPLMREDPQTGTASAASEGAYLFAVWLMLILSTAPMSRGLRKTFEPPKTVPPKSAPSGSEPPGAKD
jgi:hypothetical protein